MREEYHDYYDLVHVDEKWFFLMEEAQLLGILCMVRSDPADQLDTRVTLERSCSSVSSLGLGTMQLGSAPLMGR